MRAGNEFVIYKIVSLVFGMHLASGELAENFTAAIKWVCTLSFCGCIDSIPLHGQRPCGPQNVRFAVNVRLMSALFSFFLRFSASPSAIAPHRSAAQCSVSCGIGIQVRKVECLQLATTAAAASVNASAGQRAEYLGDGPKTNDYYRTDAEAQTAGSTQCDLNDRPPSSQPCTTGIECAPITLGSGNIDIARSGPIEADNADNGDALGVSGSGDDRDKVADEDGDEEDDDEEEADNAENGSDVARAFEEPRESGPDVREEVDEAIAEVNSRISWLASHSPISRHTHSA